MIEVSGNNHTRKRYNRIAFIYDLMEAPWNIYAWPRGGKNCTVVLSAVERWKSVSEPGKICLTIHRE